MPDKTITNVDVVELLAAEAEHVRQEIADADPHAALADLKRRLKAPRPFVGFLVLNDDWTPPPTTRQSLVYQLPLLFFRIKDAKAAKEGFRAMAPRTSRKMILEATVTFRIVEGSDHD